MSEDLLRKSRQVVRSSQSQISNSDPAILCGSGNGEGENAPLLPHQNIFIQEDEMASCFHCPLPEANFYSSCSSRSSAPPDHPPPPAPPDLLNLMNLERLRENILTGARPWFPVGSSGTPSYSLTPGMHTGGVVIGGVSRTKTFWEIAGTSSLGVCKSDTEPIQIQPATETDKKRKERQETTVEIEETKEISGSTSRKRSRAAELHNISERRRREKINEKMKALQDLIPRCNKTDKASMLDDAIEYVKSLQLQIQMMSVEGGMMYPPNMQQFMPQMATEMMGMNCAPFIPFPRQAHMGGVCPSYPAPCYTFPNIQSSDPSRVHLPNQQPYQLQFSGYMNPCVQLAGLHQMQQPPQLQNQTTSQLSFSQASSSKEHEDPDNQPTGQ